jgi:hypothetical protein
VGGQGGEMNQALYAHMNNKRKKKKLSYFPIYRSISTEQAGSLGLKGVLARGIWDHRTSIIIQACTQSMNYTSIMLELLFL